MTFLLVKHVKWNCVVKSMLVNLERFQRSNSLYILSSPYFGHICSIWLLFLLDTIREKLEIYGCLSREKVKPKEIVISIFSCSLNVTNVSCKYRKVPGHVQEQLSDMFKCNQLSSTLLFSMFSWRRKML